MSFLKGHMNRWLLAISLPLVLTGCSLIPHKDKNKSLSDVEPPPAQREFRAAWVATVGNIDWPSKAGLSTEQQQREIIQIVERLQRLRMNAIVLQVRTSCDALYDSKLEPWSQYLTGKQGQAPSPYYDPLKFWIDECHKRGIELHAWFNPFRAKVGKGREDRAPNHISKAHPELVKDYGTHLWLDPGNPAAAEHTFKVFMDVVERYDVDGIHIDDYFYPYPEKVNEKDEDDPRVIPFPDDDSFKQYQATGGKLSRPDWRRDNINQMMKRVYEGAHARKSWVQYGISPFGIARPGKPAYVKGFDQYDKLYADAELWLKKGWCDYMVPQLYWATGSPQQPYLGLLQWWIQNNPKHRHIYGGLFTSRIDGSEKSWAPSEILGQVRISQLMDPKGGNVHFSMIALTQNRKGIADQLRSGVYASDALVPATTWLDKTPPAVPIDLKAERVDAKRVEAANKWDYVTTQPAEKEAETQPAATTATTKRSRPSTRFLMPLTTQPTKVVDQLRKLGGTRITWKPGPDESTWQFTVYAKQGDNWVMKVLPASENEVIIRDSSAEKSPTTVIGVAAVDRLGNESRRTLLVLPAGAGK
jgi:uncharacterized lipoprotein YddW (UPF0748 family)